MNFEVKMVSYEQLTEEEKKTDRFCGWENREECTSCLIVKHNEKIIFSQWYEGELEDKFWHRDYSNVQDIIETAYKLGLLDGLAQATVSEKEKVANFVHPRQRERIK